MSILRIILLILAGWILWRFTKIWYQNTLQRQQKKEKEAALSSPSKKQQESAMVQCHYCGLYLPEEEASKEGKIHYCCEAHKNVDQ
ncbi:PP0621 family protein [Candidatus Parabeggiatoa sp. HSG14]|uniref:PP0621 family protein n=1 Tax=Candidatus Parabeggiatoa sp. HSG14 TaxID=3055593 RepID=UPI0025A73790|nr:PP0621 family protein [Thiotrichales bacterium HSG14]